MNNFIKNSLSMKFGHNIHNILYVPITNNILALLPIGFASYFYSVLDDCSGYKCNSHVNLKISSIV